MRNYNFHNLCSWTDDYEIICPVSPAYLIKPVRKILGGKFGGLARITFRNELEGAYQIAMEGGDTPETSFDILLYKAIYNNGVSMSLLVDHGSEVECIAEMTRKHDEKSKITILDPERDRKYFLTLSEEDLFVIFERAVGEIKINQRDESYQPSVAISL